ncbi:MAG: N-acetylmuramoyl-L-alanine amidase [Aeromonadaceae bacterium]|nr:N-acetylmuramoyl-L-alanine amidase [Aeromonadaceae bacterium]
MKKYLISCLCCLLALPVWANQLKSLRVAPSQEKTRVVFDLSSTPDYTYSFSTQPPRLTVELNSVTATQANLERQGANLGPVIRAIHPDNAGSGSRMRLVFELNGAVKPQIFTLRPQQQYGHRLVVDFSHQALAQTGSSPAAQTATTMTNRGAQPVAGTRSLPAVTTSGTAPTGKPASGRVIQMSSVAPSTRSGTAKPGEITIQEETISTQVRTPTSTTTRAPSASIKTSSRTPTLPAKSSTPTTSASMRQPLSSTPTPVSSTKSVAPSGSGMVIIAVDAGHGGKDPGAIGPRGTHEKTVTLAVARELTDLINRQPGMRAVMTRTGDYFVDLNARSEIARRQKAQLLISIHADSVDNATARGASVWILSNKRVDREMDKLLGQQDKHTQLLGGAGKVIAEAEPNPYLAQTILDLSWDNSRSEGYNIGEEVLAQIGRVARLHKAKPVHASLAVLKAPDIPSLLIETGFISNHLEEKQLASRAYQRQIATAIFRGVRGYYAENPPEGTRIASQPTPSKDGAGSIRHVVRNGESLSGLAQRYGVSKRKLRDHNSLKSEQLLIGQVLYIPAS